MIRLALLALAIVLWASSVAAQDRDVAREHFERGIELFNEGRLDAALAEFQAAYDAAPAYPVLYNLGRVHAELGRPVEAAEAFARYLEEGGSEIGAARRTEVEELLGRARARIGRLEVVSNVEGSTVSVDGIDVATTPLPDPLSLGAGRHSIGVRAPGYESVTFAIDLAGGVVEHLVAELRAEVVPRGSLRVHGEPGGIEVSVDGVVVGTTPLASTIPVPAGEHDVAGSRPGYRSDVRRVTVEDGAEVDVRLVLARDPDAPAEVLGSLVLALPDARVVVRVDGEMLDASAAMRLPVGPHEVAIEADDRAPWVGDVTVSVALELRLAPPLEWTPDARHDRVAAARALRDGGLGTAIAGAAVLAAAVSVLGWNEAEIASTDARITTLGDEYRAMGCPPLTLRCQEIETELARLESRQSEQDVVRGVSIAALLLGAGLGTLGLVLVLGAPSEADVDRAARAELRLRPGRLDLVF